MLSLCVLEPLRCPSSFEEALDVEHYPVDDGPGTLLERLDLASPIRHDGRCFHGFTRWQVGWQFWWQTGLDGRCRLSRHRVEVRGRILLPQFSSTDPQRQAAFAHYLDRLRAHELGHFRFGRAAGRAIDRLFAGFDEVGSVEQLEQMIGDGAEALLRRYRRAEREYDRDTEHGARQGAVLLPA